MTFTADDHRWMARALQLAERGLYSTDPNPRVGCVLVRDGRAVGEGWHAKAGEPHAETHALRAAGELAHGATAYVTLEPCAHFGRTPPCADALAAAGVARVVYAVGDPFPHVAGAGHAKLEAAGIVTEEGCLRAQAEALNPGFLKRLRTGRPYVRVKLAQSLDGRTALANGESRWITGEAARADVQRLRARSSVVLSSAATVLRDGATLNVRDATLDRRGREPVRAILDRDLASTPDAPLFAASGPVMIYTDARHAGMPGGSREVDVASEAGTGAALRARAEVVAVPSTAAGLDLDAVLADLAARHANEVLVEAGATLAGAFVAARLVDELVLYVAPHVLGDAARPLLRLPELRSMRERVAFSLRDVRQVGADLRLTLAPSNDHGA